MKKTGKGVISTSNKKEGIECNVSFYDGAGLPISADIVVRESRMKTFKTAGEMVSEALHVALVKNAIDTGIYCDRQVEIELL